MSNKHLLYNVTVKISHDVSSEWLDWMKNKHIQDVLDTGCFISARLSKMKYLDETDGLTYSIQYLCESNIMFEKYNENYATSLQQDSKDLFKDKFLVFRSIMEVEKDFEYKN